MKLPIGLKLVFGSLALALGIALGVRWMGGPPLSPAGVAVAVAAFAAGLYGLGEWLVGRPLRRLGRAIDRIEQGGRLETLPLARGDELGALVNRLNRFLTRLCETREIVTMLYETSRLLASPVEMKEAVHQVLAAASYRYGLGACAVFLRKSGEQLQSDYSWGLSDEFAQSLAIQIGEGVAGQAFAESSVRMVPETHDEKTDSLLVQFSQRHQVRSALFIPLTSEGRTLGLAAFFSRAPHDFGHDRVEAMTAFAAYLSLAIRNSQMYSQLREFNRRLEVELAATTQELTQTNTRLIQRVRELRTVYELAIATATATHVEEVTQIVVARVKELLDVELGAVFLTDTFSGELVPVAPAFGLTGTALTELRCHPDDGPWVSRVVHQGEPVLYNVVDRPGQVPAAWDRVSIRSVLMLPLRTGNQVVGLFCAANKLHGIFTTDDERVLSLLTNRVTEVMDRVSVYERLRETKEKLEQINRMKNEFISLVSHELRTPMTTIKGYISVVLGGETGSLTPQQRKFLETADHAIDRLSLLVSDLLDISRIEAGQIRMQLRPVSIAEILKRAVANFEHQAKDRRITLQMAMPEGLPRALADPERLLQVTDNLLSNAFKFTSAGGRVTLNAEDKGDYLLVSVADTGEGIPKSEHEKIFEKFYQIRSGGSWPAKGTGLGLAIVKSIIESHRGRVWVESESGQGATFFLMIPRAKTTETQPTPISPSPQEGEGVK